MGMKTQYVEIDFCHEKKRFICKSDREGIVLKVLECGDKFHLNYMDEATVGHVKAAEEAKPYGYLFLSEDELLKVELEPGMYGYIEEDLPDSRYLGAEPEKF